MTGDKKNKIFTIPNLLSFFRLCLIPLFVWLYCWKQDYMMTTAVLLLSGLTDLADGYIARHFDMVSDLGKALDPIADKLTQAAMMLCLLTRFKLMLFPLLLIAVKELSTGIFSLVVIKKTGKVLSADWHGKLTTLLLYIMMIVHVLWYDIPYSWSVVLILTCMWMMLLSFGMYLVRNYNTLRNSSLEEKQKGDLPHI